MTGPISSANCGRAAASVWGRASSCGATGAGLGDVAAACVALQAHGHQLVLDAGQPGHGVAGRAGDGHALRAVGALEQGVAGLGEQGVVPGHLNADFRGTIVKSFQVHSGYEQLAAFGFDDFIKAMAK